MKIAIDISKLHDSALKRGVGVYAFNLFKHLNKLNDENSYYLNKKNSENLIIDLVHYPYFDPYFLTLPFFKNKPVVVTVHDLTPLKFLKHHPPGIRGSLKWQWQKTLLKKVEAVMVDSKNSKKDLIEIINFPEERIHVVYLAASEEYSKLGLKDKTLLAVKQKHKLPNNFVLYVGDLNWNKNVKGLIQAFGQLKKSARNLKLVLVGEAFHKKKLKETDEIKKLIKKLKLASDVLFLGYISNQDLTAIYNLATLYVQPSFYEGFGLPVLEAMSCGCPVLCSNQASLPEIGDNAVKYFNPFDKKGLAAKLKILVSNPSKLKELSRLGSKQAKKFSWRKTAFKTRKIYLKYGN